MTIPRPRVALVALVLALMALVGPSSCSKVSIQTGTAGGANPWTRHGVLRMDEVAEPDNLNPFVGNQQIEVDLSMFWAGYLFRWSDRSEFVPELATEVPTTHNGGISKDGRSITYHLRKGVRWDDGVAFTAADVIYSWQQAMNKDNNVASRQGYDLITGIAKPDDYTIVVHLSRPYAPFIASFFSLGPTVINILPKHALRQYPNINRVPYNNHPIGIGPFKVASYEKGRAIKFIANPLYWRGRPKLDEIDVHFIPDENTIATQLRTHETDMERAADPGYVPTYRTIPGVRLYITPFTAYAQLALNLQNPILKDKRVRQALAYATDKQTIIGKVAHGIPTPADSDQPPFLWAFNPKLKRYGYDPQQAAALLDAAGWRLGNDGFRYRDGQRLTLLMVSNTGGGTVRAVEVIVQQEWRRVGIDASIKEYAPPLFFASYGEGGIVQAGKFDVAFLGWVNGVDPDDSTEWMCDQIPPNGQNVYHFCNRALDAAEQIALMQYEQSTRKAAYDTIQSILAEETPAIFIWFTNRVTVANTDLKGYLPAHAVSTMWNPWAWEI